MSDINTPNERRHPEEPAEGADDRSARDGAPQESSDDAAPDEDMSSYNIEPPPTEDGEVPGVPDASGALGDEGSDEPGSNATEVGA